MAEAARAAALAAATAVVLACAGAAAPGAPLVRLAQTAPRTAAGEPGLAPVPGGGADEWQWAAARENAVPAAVLRAAAAITIAVVDTGADLSAPDLAAKAPAAYDAVTGGTDVTDRDGHGTFVASLAAGAVANGDGIAGFGGDARLMIVKASSGGTFTDQSEAAAIVWAVDHGAKIVNLSFGGTSTSPTERAAVDYAVAHDVLLVAAAGNEHAQGDPVEYPAALLQPVGSDGVGGVGLSVGASTADGTAAPFSNRGSYLSLVAPGVDVLGDVSSASSPGSYPRVPLPGAQAGLYGLGSGTSFAAPEVAGAAALVWAANPQLSAAGVAQILKQTASNHGAWNPDTGWGVLDVGAAVALASGSPATAPQATVRLSGRRVGRRVELAWTGSGAAAYRLAVSEDRGPAHTLLQGVATSASYPLRAGHAYVFTVAAVDASGTPLASSAPYRASARYPSARSIRAPSARSRSSIRS